MIEERKVLCPCGKEMHFGCTERACSCGEAPWGGMYTCRCGWHSPYREGDTPEDCEHNAYAAATRRPPNLPLTKEQVESMDELDAVWVAYDEDDTATNIVFAADALYTIRQGNRDKGLYFAAKPTPADIEAARKESP